MSSTDRQHRARTGRALLAAVAVAAASVVAPSPSASAAETLTVQRFSGPDRYATAAALAKEAHPSGAGVVLIASGESFPDALAATTLAGTSKAPVLLTRATDAPEATLEALRTLRPRRLIAIGGTGRITNAAFAQAASAAGLIFVDRISGPDRYTTAARVAQELEPADVGLIGGKRTAFLATGERFPDALSAGSVAAAAGLPLLMTPPGALPQEVGDTITKLGVTQVVLLGGQSSVSSGVDAALSAKGLATVRLGGADRQDTAAKVADWAVDNAGMSGSRVALARGDDAGGGADALALGPLAGLRRTPVLLAQSPQQVGAATRAWAGRRGATLTNVDVAGGRGAVSDTVIEEVPRAVAGIPETPTPPSNPPAGGPGGKAKTCAQQPGCRVVGSVDFDGDGVLEELRYAALPDFLNVDGTRDNTTAIFVVPSSTGTADGQQYIETPFNGYCDYLGAADIDGVPGAELVLDKRVPNNLPFPETSAVVPTWKNGKVDQLRDPTRADSPLWTVRFGDGTTGITCESPGDITVGATTSHGYAEDTYDGTVTRYRWDRAGGSWTRVSSSNVTGLSTADLGPEWSGWTCPGITKR